jgi:hypothetical protein
VSHTCVQLLHAKGVRQRTTSVVWRLGTCWWCAPRWQRCGPSYRVGAAESGPPHGLLGHGHKNRGMPVLCNCVITCSVLTPLLCKVRVEWLAARGAHAASRKWCHHPIQVVEALTHCHQLGRVLHLWCTVSTMRTFSTEFRRVCVCVRESEVRQCSACHVGWRCAHRLLSRPP